MTDRAKGALKRVTLLVLVAALFATLFSVTASANNLDARTATNAARDVARKDCQQTRGCTDYRVLGLRKRTAHKAVGKIGVAGDRDGIPFVCTRQIVVKLDHFTGDINYAVSRRRCR